MKSMIGRTLLASVALLFGCSADRMGARAEGLDSSSIPAEVRADYDVFTARCSKCHSLARPLNSGIEEDAYWALYVARMRRQPASGISHEDEVAVLRFLHYFSIEQRRLKAKKNESTSSAPSPSPAPAPPLPVPGPPPAPPSTPVSPDAGG